MDLWVGLLKKGALSGEPFENIYQMEVMFMKMKSIVSSVAAFALMAASVVGDFPQYFPTAYAEEVSAGGTELKAPQNVRVEDGFLKWDGSEEDYGYMISAIDKNDQGFGKQWFDTELELDRFLYENNCDFGEYKFQVCVIDKSCNTSTYSDPVTFTYAAAFTTPTNVKLSDEVTSITWDEVEGTKRYNIRVFKNGENKTLYIWTWTSTNSWNFGFGMESGDYLFSVQAMDGDYNVSEWTEPITFTHTEKTIEAPKNVRLDDSGENILWDEVEGAGFYNVEIWSTVVYDKWNSSATCPGGNVEETQFDNWKFQICPFAEKEHRIRVSVGAYENETYVYAYSDFLDVTYEPDRDETIVLPEKIVADGNFLRWENNIIDGAQYWVRVMSYGDIVINHWYNIDPNGGIYVGNNEYPAGNYDVELYVVNGSNKYNFKTYTFTSEAVQDETVWIPEMYYKFDALVWDYDRLRHDDTNFFWLRIKKDDAIVKLINTYNDNYYGLPDLEDGEYTVEICTYESPDKLSPWSKPLLITKHGEALFDKENEVTESVEAPPEAADVPEEDRITSITINPAFNMKHKDGDDVELDLTKIKIKAKEIYDEEGLKRASEALGETIKGNTHYNLLDLTLLYGEEDFSNGYNGLVQVVIPIPKGHRDKNFSCYRLKEENGKTVKELIPGEQTEDSYIVYLEHFSEYALVGTGEGDEPDEPGTTTPAADFYKIDLKTDGHGTATANVENTEKVEEGTEVTLTAKPNSGYKFSKWTVTKGDVTIKDNKFTMPGSDVEITAEFAKNSSGGSGSSGGSSGGSRRPNRGSSSTTTETVTVNGKTGGWSDVTGTINTAANGSTITISGSVDIPADVIAAAAAKSIKLEVKVNDTFTWVLDAAKVGAGSKYLSVADAVINVTNKTIKSTEASKSFRVTESGLGTGASLRYNAGKDNSGKFANLFRVNGSALEFVGVVKVDAAGNALLPITSAGAHKIVISGETKLVGDLDNSTGLNALDAALMLKKLVNNEVAADETAKFDFNGDGKTNALDAAAILKWIVNN